LTLTRNHSGLVQPSVSGLIIVLFFRGRNKSINKPNIPYSKTYIAKHSM
jgi:hypothetical protein